MTTFTRGQLKAGLDSLRLSRWRSFWTMLGVIIGVASVITIVGIGEGVKHQISGQIHHMGKNLIIIRPGVASSNSAGGLLSGLNVTGTLSSQDLAVITKVEGVTSLAPLASVSGDVTSETGHFKNANLIGTTQDLPGLINQSLAYGAFLSVDDAGLNVAVLGQKSAESLFNVAVPLGRSFNFRGQKFIVRGIFNHFDSAPLSQQADFNNGIFIPYDIAQSLTKNTAPTYEILAKTNNTSEVNRVSAAITSALVSLRGGGQDFTVSAQNQDLSSNDGVLDLMTRMIASIAAISLLVGGIGIMNVMLVSVSERIHEIGIRKAIGATNRQILNQFMIEATLLSLIGGMLGVLVAYIIDLVLRIFTNLQPYISWQLIAVAMGVSLAVGVVFGTIPAFQAARKDPIKALRAEH